MYDWWTDGKWRAPTNASTNIEVRNPSNNAVIATVPAATLHDVRYVMPCMCNRMLYTWLPQFTHSTYLLNETDITEMLLQPLTQHLECGAHDLHVNEPRYPLLLRLTDLKMMDHMI
jgi:hypothetical protein